VRFVKDKNFLYQAIQPVLRAKSEQARVFWGPRIFALSDFFSCHHASSWVLMSSTKIFVQETRAEYHTLAAHQDEYHPQDSQRSKGFQVQERAAEQSATRPVSPTNKSGNHQGSAGNPEDQAS
jgi:hypothetical protein